MYFICVFSAKTCRTEKRTLQGCSQPYCFGTGLSVKMKLDVLARLAGFLLVPKIHLSLPANAEVTETHRAF